MSLASSVLAVVGSIIPGCGLNTASSTALNKHTGFISPLVQIPNLRHPSPANPQQCLLERALATEQIHMQMDALLFLSVPHVGLQTQRH